MTASMTQTEMKIVMADPTALGVFGLATVTFVAASQKLGWTTGSAYLIPWAMFLGSFAQIWASTVDFKKNNYFGAIVLGAYGLFWMGFPCIGPLARAGSAPSIRRRMTRIN